MLRLAISLAATALVLTVAVLAPASVKTAAAPVPPERALYTDGPDGRHLLETGWTTRPDPGDDGLRERWQKLGMEEGFRPVRVPHAFNARVLDARGMRSRVQWYRATFSLPPGPAAGWRLRFESVGNGAKVFLNGRPIGRHQGAHLPFELDARGIKEGENELVVRVDGRESRRDIPPRGNERGWWNYGGILREVYLRRVRDLDVSDVQVITRLGNPAKVEVSAAVRNAGRRAQPFDFTLSASGPGGFAVTRQVPVPGRFARGRTERVSAAFDIPGARPWSPDDPALYQLRLAAGGQTTTLHFGVREWAVDGQGRATLNGRPLSLRGLAFHEDVPNRGHALTPADRAAIVSGLVASGSDFTRVHYPPHPAFLEEFDRRGIVLWEQTPVWRLNGRQLANGGLRAKALEVVRETVTRDRNHASVLAWALTNETQDGGSGEAGFIRAANAEVKKLDPTRLTAADAGLRPKANLNPVYAELDAVGITEYIGWYGKALSSELRGDLDELRARFPDEALFVTEFGAEANRAGSAAEKGTFAFQAGLLDEHLTIIGDTPQISGAIGWILRDFPVRPGWDGGNPRPRPPFNYKGVLDRRGRPKQAFGVVRDRFRAVPPTK